MSFKELDECGLGDGERFRCFVKGLIPDPDHKGPLNPKMLDMLLPIFLILRVYVQAAWAESYGQVTRA